MNPATELTHDAAADRLPRSGIGHALDLIEKCISGALIGGALLLVTVTVLMRLFVPAMAPNYAEEVTVYMVVWAVLIACGGVTRTRSHVRADLVVGFMSPQWQRICDIASNLLGFAFAAFLVWYGFQVAHEAFTYNDLSASHVRFPLWIYYSALPVAAALMCFAHLGTALGLITGRLAPASAETIDENEVKRWEA
jgi:TRAP-type C4-dicarboxylate transport system permease small subunit